MPGTAVAIGRCWDMPESRQFAEARARFAQAIRRTKGRTIARDLDLEVAVGFEAHRLLAEAFLDSFELPAPPEGGAPVSRDTLHALGLATISDGDQPAVLLVDVEEGMVVNTFRLSVDELQGLIDREPDPRSPAPFLIMRPSTGQHDRNAEATRLIKEMYGVAQELGEDEKDG